MNKLDLLSISSILCNPYTNDLQTGLLISDLLGNPDLKELYEKVINNDAELMEVRFYCEYVLMIYLHRFYEKRYPFTENPNMLPLFSKSFKNPSLGQFQFKEDFLLRIEKLTTELLKSQAELISVGFEENYSVTISLHRSRAASLVDSIRKNTRLCADLKSPATLTVISLNSISNMEDIEKRKSLNPFASRRERFSRLVADHAPLFNSEIEMCLLRDDILNHCTMRIYGNDSMEGKTVFVVTAKKLPYLTMEKSFGYMWIELSQPRDNPGWIKGKADLIALERDGGVTFLDRNALLKFVESKLIQKYISWSDVKNGKPSSYLYHLIDDGLGTIRTVVKIEDIDDYDESIPHSSSQYKVVKDHWMFGEDSHKNYLEYLDMANI